MSGMDPNSAASALERLSTLRRSRDDLTHLILLAVEDAHDAGATWEAIGEALGVSRQAAQQRYRKTD